MVCKCCNGCSSNDTCSKDKGNGALAVITGLQMLRSKKILYLTLLIVFVSLKSLPAGIGVEHMGDILVYALPGAAAGLSLGNNDGEGLLQMTKSACLALGTTYILKHTINEKRPDGENYSFPSGHSTASFFTAEYLRKRYGWQYGAPAYAAAIFVAYSRVAAKKHYPHDVLAGAAIGMAASALFTRPYQRWRVDAGANHGVMYVRIARCW